VREYPHRRAQSTLALPSAFPSFSCLCGLWRSALLASAPDTPTAHNRQAYGLCGPPPEQAARIRPAIILCVLPTPFPLFFPPFPTPCSRRLSVFLPVAAVPRRVPPFCLAELEDPNAARKDGKPGQRVVEERSAPCGCVCAVAVGPGGRSGLSAALWRFEFGD
jgi:hypothetical protein